MSWSLYCMHFRELAFQIGEQFSVLGKPIGLKEVVVIGGRGNPVDCSLLFWCSHIEEHSLFRCSLNHNFIDCSLISVTRHGGSRSWVGHQASRCRSYPWTPCRSPEIKLWHQLQKDCISCEWSCFTRYDVFLPQFDWGFGWFYPRLWMKLTGCWRTTLESSCRRSLLLCQRSDRPSSSVPPWQTHYESWRILLSISHSSGNPQTSMHSAPCFRMIKIVCLTVLLSNYKSIFCGHILSCMKV